METLTIIGIVCLVAGFVLVGIEMAVPGFGIWGITGIAALIAGIFLTADGVEQGITLTIIIVVVLGIMLTVTMTFFSRKNIKSRLVLEEEVKADKGYLNNADLEYLVGKEGQAATELRPEGKGNFDGVEFHVRAEHGYIKKGERICIVQVKGTTLLVKNAG